MPARIRRGEIDTSTYSAWARGTSATASRTSRSCRETRRCRGWNLRSRKDTRKPSASASPRIASSAFASRPGTSRRSRQVPKARSPTRTNPRPIHHALRLVIRTNYRGIGEKAKGPSRIRGPSPSGRTRMARWSGRPDSNRRRQAWEACILPLNYARLFSVSYHRPIPRCNGTLTPGTSGHGPEDPGSPGRTRKGRGRSPSPPPPFRSVTGEPPSGTGHRWIPRG